MARGSRTGRSRRSSRSSAICDPRLETMAMPNSPRRGSRPLAEGEAAALVEQLRDLPGETRARIVEAAEGNPLFVEQLVAMQAESGNGQLEIPPTIQALLGARIDRLEPEERAVIERASIEG